MNQGVEVVSLVAQDAFVQVGEERFCPPDKVGVEVQTIPVALGFHCCQRVRQFQRRHIPVPSGREGVTPRMRPRGSQGQWLGCNLGNCRQRDRL